ncbi:MAG: carbohydrate kinase family protein [Candidatus Bathyarchaeia archaeon]|nr:carbohydrate kinase family protein [Candidatus Bathyarchaeia archaeon]
MFGDFLGELQRFLKSEIEELNVVVMPDFFLDRLVSLNCDVKAFSENLGNVVRRKGGSIDRIEQTELRGGNAINTASALAALDVKTTPIVCTNKLGAQLIKFYLKPETANLSHIKIFEKSSITTAIEFKTENGKINVMLRDVGSLADFGPHHLSDEDFEATENADYVCVFNWAGTRRFGTELAETVFRHAKMKGRGKTYYDTADPTPNKGKITELVKNVLQSKYVDVLSVNENEAICYASQLSSEIEELRRSLKFDELAKESARVLASHLSARVDLHTTSFSASFTKKGETVISVFQVPVLRATGAGDAWNAGNILGDAHGLSDGCRLTLANVVAAYYISNPNGMHPTRKQLIEFCEKLKRKSTL